jgi:hypothetical protein
MSKHCPVCSAHNEGDYTECRECGAPSYARLAGIARETVDNVEYAAEREIDSGSIWLVIICPLEDALDAIDEAEKRGDD